MVKVFIAIPNLHWICTPLALTIPHWLKNFQSVVFAPEMLKPISYARNFCVERFLESKADYFFLVDADVAPAPRTLETLLSAGEDVVAAKVHQLKLDDDGIVKPCPMFMRYDKDRNFRAAYGEGVGKIDRAGFACILFKRHVFEVIKRPWFDLRPWGASRGTDFIFCEKMEKAGIPLHAHFEVECRQLVQQYI